MRVGGKVGGGEGRGEMVYRGGREGEEGGREGEREKEEGGKKRGRNVTSVSFIPSAITFLIRPMAVSCDREFKLYFVL